MVAPGEGKPTHLTRIKASEPPPVTLEKIKKAAKARAEGLRWPEVAPLIERENAHSAAQITHEYPDAWRREYELARVAALQDFCNESVQTQRTLLGPLSDVWSKGEDGSWQVTDKAPRPESLRQSAAHSGLVMYAKTLKQQVDLGIDGGGLVVNLTLAEKPKEEEADED